MRSPSRQMAYAVCLACALATIGCRRETFGGPSTSYPAPTATSSQLAVVKPLSPPKKGAPPRILLTESLLANVLTKVKEGRPEWTALEKQCLAWANAKVEWPDGEDYPPVPNIGEGYQGDAYYPAFMNLAVCYQVTRLISPERAEPYARRAVDMLTKMSATDGPHAVNPLRDDGFGIRHFGISLAIGYDWLRDELNAEQKAQMVNALDRWISKYEEKGFGHNHPQGNYYAGYFACKALAALAVSGDDPRGDKWFSDWRDRVYGRLVQPYYARYLAGGGWPEGWNYGGPAAFNMILPIMAVKTALGIDLISDPNAPFTYAIDTAQQLLQFSWPTRRTMDDRAMLYAAENPAAVSLPLALTVLSLLEQRNDPLAPVFHRFVREVKEAKGARASELWQEALFWDSTGKEAGLETLPRSYFSKGMSTVAMRSGWEKDAVWASFTSGPYVGNPDSGEMYFDQGSFAIVRGSKPFVVNSSGALVRHTPGTTDGGGGKEWDKVYADLFGNHDADPTQANRTIFNVFYFKGPRTGQIGPPVSETRTAIERYEDRGAYVLARGEHLEDLYRKAGREKVVKSWTRQVVYLRPKLVVVDDRTEVGDVTDQYQAFHVNGKPEPAASPDHGSHRFDVGKEAAFAGAVTSLLPKDHTVTTADLFDRHKVYRIEVHAKTKDNIQRWLSVFDASDASGDVAVSATMSAAAGNVKKGGVVGAQIVSSKGRFIVLAGSGPADERVSGPITYVAGGPATHIVTDLRPGAAYGVSVSGSGEITIVSGGPLVATPVGVLAFTSDASGKIVPVAP